MAMHTYNASDKQLSFIRNLLNDRDVDGETKPWVESIPDINFLSTHEASDLIGRLLLMPKRTKQTGAKHEFITEDGMYRTPEGVIYKVQYNKATGDGRRLYAKKLVVTVYREFDAHTVGHNGAEDVDVRFEYAAGALRFLTADMRMTLEQAKEFGALYGTCCVCGRTLTNEESIEAGIGPICAGKL